MIRLSEMVPLRFAAAKISLGVMSERICVVARRYEDDYGSREHLNDLRSIKGIQSVEVDDGIIITYNPALVDVVELDVGDDGWFEFFG